MYRLATKRSERNRMPKLLNSLEYGYSQSKTHVVQCAAIVAQSANGK